MRTPLRVEAFVGSASHTNNRLVNGELALKVSAEAATKDAYNQVVAEAHRMEAFPAPWLFGLVREG